MSWQSSTGETGWRHLMPDQPRCRCHGQPPALHTGAVGWAALAAGVLVWDFLATETLSSAFHRASRGRGGPVVVAGWVVLTAHLLGILPELDPLERAYARLEHRRVGLASQAG
jgi:hypothetical protein